MTRRRLDSISFRFASSSPRSLSRASSRSCAGVSSGPSPIWRTYSLSGSAVCGSVGSVSTLSTSSTSAGAATTSSRGSGASRSGSASGSGRCSITPGLSALTLPRLRETHPHEGSGFRVSNREERACLTLRTSRRHNRWRPLRSLVSFQGFPEMCGIAGYSLSARSSVDRTLAAQALLAGIAERGADAVGYAYRRGEGPATIHKQRSGASALLEDVIVPASTTEALIHVRDYTKGHPSVEANNHPIRHGAVVGVHNGIILNDDKLMDEHGFERAESA